MAPRSILPWITNRFYDAMTFLILSAGTCLSLRFICNAFRYHPLICTSITGLLALLIRFWLSLPPPPTPASDAEVKDTPSVDPDADSGRVSLLERLRELEAIQYERRSKPLPETLQPRVFEPFPLVPYKAPPTPSWALPEPQVGEDESARSASGKNATVSSERESLPTPVHNEDDAERGYREDGEPMDWVPTPLRRSFHVPNNCKTITE